MERKCVGCGTIKDKKDLIKVTAQKSCEDVIVNGYSKIFGRSAYLCYNISCVENAFKKNKLKKSIKNSNKRGFERNNIK